MGEKLNDSFSHSSRLNKSEIGEGGQPLPSPTQRKLCEVCNFNLARLSKRVRMSGEVVYHQRTLCHGCVQIKNKKNYERPYAVHKKASCDFCNFVALNKCQLDIDHIDGNKKNNAVENLRTLCSNCHRLKTHMNKEWVNKAGGRRIGRKITG